MSIDVGKSVRTGGRAVLSPRGLVVGLSLLVIAMLNLYAQQSIQLHVQRWLFGVIAEGETQDAMLAQAGSQLPFALEVALPVLLGIVFAVLLVDELVRLVAIRLFASESSDPLPFDDVADGFGSAAVKALVLGGGLSLVVTLVNVVPILGQIVGWALVLLFVFLRQVVALEDRGFVETLSESVSLFLEDPGPVVLILLLLGILGAVVSGVVPFVLGFALTPGAFDAGFAAAFENVQALSTVVSAVLGVVFQVLGIAVVTDAYTQVRTSRDEATA